MRDFFRLAIAVATFLTLAFTFIQWVKDDETA